MTALAPQQDVREKPAKPREAARVQAVRCAIYCRKSSDDGLDQSFNSLDAQRASGEAYITSHEGEGWRCLPERYEDGGYSGGTMDRPALKRLLADIDAGGIDAVVIYKLDRLTRSIRHFGEIMATLEQRNVALMVVTQPIQTNTSMGRLMVHVLMSFAEFERELASERTRDKIALTRQRGEWTGGRPVLGYDIVDSRLVLNAAEAAVVRGIFRRYIECKSIRVLAEALASEGVLNKAWTTHGGTGRAAGGGPFIETTLARLLTNPLYIGRVPHEEKSYVGVHEAIVDEKVFARVQEIIAENTRAGVSLVRNKVGGLLKGLIRCGCCGAPMVHGWKDKGGKVYRYYTCQTRQAVSRKRCTGGNVPAEQIEQFVVAKVRPVLEEPEMVTAVLDVARGTALERLRDVEARRVLLGPEPDRRLLGDLNREERELRVALVDRSTVESGVRSFDPIWASLSPTERAKLMALVVAGVVFDPAKGEIKITLHEEPLGSGATTAAAVGGKEEKACPRK